MRESSGGQIPAHKTEERHLQESNEALLKMAQAMAAQLQAAQKAANTTQNTGKDGSTGSTDSKTK
jgi:hypothetical protein